MRFGSSEFDSLNNGGGAGEVFYATLRDLLGGQAAAERIVSKAVANLSCEELYGSTGRDALSAITRHAGKATKWNRNESLIDDAESGMVGESCGRSSKGDTVQFRKAVHAIGRLPRLWRRIAFCAARQCASTREWTAAKLQSLACMRSSRKRKQDDFRKCTPADFPFTTLEVKENMTAALEDGLGDVLLEIERLGGGRDGKAVKRPLDHLCAAYESIGQRYTRMNYDAVNEQLGLKIHMRRKIQRLGPLIKKIRHNVVETIDREAAQDVFSTTRKKDPIYAQCAVGMVPDSDLYAWEGRHISPNSRQLVGDGADLRSQSRKVLRQRDRRKCVRGGLNGAVLKWHEQALEDYRVEQEKATRRRLAALKSSDVKQYLELLQGAKNARIDDLLRQTDECLRRLTTKLKSLRSGKNGTKESAFNLGNQREGGIDSFLDSSAVWDSLTISDQSDVKVQPEMLKGGELRDYQMQGLRWMVSLYQNGMNGILADEMGLGKTIQVIAYVCHLIETRQSSHPFLIASPASVVANWATEFERWAPDVKVVTYKGPAADRTALFHRRIRGKKFDVLLTTYDFLMGKNDRGRLAKIKWSSIVIDEGHRLKNSECKLNTEIKKYTAKRRLLLTGTPLQNKIDELWSLLNFLMPDLFSSSDDFNSWFGLPTGPAACTGNSQQQDQLLNEEDALLVTNRLHQVLRPFMLRRLKNVVTLDLPPKIERLVPCPLSAYQRVLYSMLKSELEQSGAVGLRGINNAYMEMKSICNHPFISRLHPPSGEDMMPPHILPAIVRVSSKLEMLDRILHKMHKMGHKVLVFCTMTRVLDLIEELVEWRGYEYIRMDGNTLTEERGRIVQQFNDPDSPISIFMLSTRAGGVGLNLQSADTVIMFDTDPNPQIDLQAQARAHRIGQKRPVLVLRLHVPGTIEDEIIQKAISKKNEADRSITGGFFDGHTTAEARRGYLIELLRRPGFESNVGNDHSDALSSEAFNELLARQDGEKDVFAREDERMQLVEAAKWAKVDNGGAQYQRLASKDEVGALEAAALELFHPPPKENADDYTDRRRRRNAAVKYADLTDRQFNQLCEGKPPEPTVTRKRKRKLDHDESGRPKTATKEKDSECQDKGKDVAPIKRRHTNSSNAAEPTANFEEGKVTHSSTNGAPAAECTHQVSFRAIEEYFRVYCSGVGE